MKATAERVLRVGVPYGSAPKKMNDWQGRQTRQGSQSQYIRRLCFGGRPVTSRTDSQTIRELRRLGGLLKHNFESVREAGGQQALPKMEDTLEAVRLAIERLSRE